jgi:hypothetical protein
VILRLHNLLPAWLLIVSAAAEPAKPRHWSFAPLPGLSALKAGEMADRIDERIRSELRSCGLEPAPEADRRSLLRRLSFDLVGLPPTPEEVDAFRSDRSADAWTRRIDALLKSPHHGERWARHWLDLARYTDKTASWLDSTASAWLYRDWVVRAFNEDLPYPDFVRRQLAADLLPDTRPEDNAALGFFGLSPTYWKELQLPPEIIKGTVADEWEERVDALGRTFLGLTLACARCHDHKSDPVTMLDYYAVAGVFANLKLADRPTIESKLWAPVAKARSEVAGLEKRQTELKKQKPGDLKEQLEKLSARIKAIQDATPHYHVPMANGVMDAALHVKANPKKHGTVLEYDETGTRDLAVHHRGDPNVTGEIVPRRFLAVFDGESRPFRRGSGRLDLADALMKDARPLVARVIVNRVWHHHFGRGLVRTPSEFGAAGDPASHPELLDELAARFVAGGWSLKWLHRAILGSRTWRQACTHPTADERDPDNRLLARMNRRRLDVEAWRDAMLSVSGSLDTRLGGAPSSLADTDNRRRSLYGAIHRRDLDKMLAAHDFPDPTAHSPARHETTTPLQQLFTLNGPLLRHQAGRLADRVAGVTDPDARVRRLHHLLFQRDPTEAELHLASAFLSDPGTDNWSHYAHALLASNEFLYLD